MTDSQVDAGTLAADSTPRHGQFPVETDTRAIYDYTGGSVIGKIYLPGLKNK